jgi:DNA-binding transcriptional LysR family regulator
VTENECTPGLIKKLKNDELDFVFASRLPKDSDVEFVPVCEQNLVVILPLESEYADRECIDLTELEEMPFISYSGKTGLKKEIYSLFEMAEIIPKIYCEVDGDITMIGMVAANIGFAIVPETPILRRFKVKVMPIRNPAYKRVIHLGFMKNRYETLPVQHFKDYVDQNGKEIMFSVLKGGEKIQAPVTPA